MSVILSKKAISSYVRTFGIALLFMTISSIYMLNKMILDITKVQKNTLDKVYNVDGLDLTSMCNSIGCDRVVYKEKSFVPDNHYVLKRNYDALYFYTRYEYKVSDNVVVNDKLYEKFTYNNVILYIPLNIYILGTMHIIIYTIIIMFVLSIILHIKYSFMDAHASNIESKAKLLEAETKLQRTLVEFANHEIVLPLAVIKTCINDLYRELYPCTESIDGICTFKYTTFNVCSTCPIANRNRSVDMYSKDSYFKLGLAVEQIEAVLGQMSDNKNIKYGNGNISIAKIIRTAVNAVNIDVNKIAYEIIDEDILEDYAVKFPSSNALILTVLSNHITNSKEALATTIRFKFTLDTVSKIIHLQLIDNGSGIRDSTGNIIDPSKVFDKGFTTKNKEGKNVFIKESKAMIFVKRLFGLYKETTAVRGIGMFVNRELMRKHKGNITIAKTDKNGTIFVIAFPYKPVER